MTSTPRMTPAEYGRYLASQTPPITDGQADAAARIFASVERDQARDIGDSAKAS